jgi:predicted dehydrogenase
MRIGLLSFAHVHAAGYAARLSRMPDVELAAADDDVDRGAELAGKLGIRFFSSYEDLFAWRPDGVVVCVENVGHRSLTEAAAEAGAHVLCEKPLATTLADARAMIESCRRAGVRLMTAFPMRFSPPVGALQGLLREGRLGRVVACTGTNQGQMPGHERAWFVDPALAGGGAVMDHTVHVADLLGWLLDVPAVEVYAQSNRICHAGSVAVETGGLLVVTYADGTVATIDCSWDRPDSFPTWGGLTLEVVGERGTVAVDAFSQVVGQYSDRERNVAWLPWGSDLDARMLDEFVAGVREGRQPQPDGEAGLRALEIALGAYRSTETGQPVPLPLDGGR